jgi:hypothetical protein
MENFKTRWEIEQNWQLIFPLLGLFALGYSAYKLALVSLKDKHIAFILFTAIVLFIILLKFILFLFKKLEKKWVLKHRWEMIRVFIVFAITGSSSVFIGRPFIETIGITKENLNPILYWVLFIIIGLIFYQILLVTLGWLFGQFQFFWEFEKKMLKRFGLGKFIS